MENKFNLVIEYTDAGIYYNNINDFFQKDKIIKNGKYFLNRSSEKHCFKDCLVHVNHISNLLHVMTNKRPVPSFREVMWDRNEELFECAKESYIKFYDLSSNSFNDENLIYKRNFINKSSMAWNSWRKIITSYWLKLEDYLSNEKYEKLLIFLNEKYNINENNTSLDQTLKILENDWGDVLLPNQVNYRYDKSFNDIIGIRFDIGEYKYLTNPDKKFKNDINTKKLMTKRLVTKDVSIIKNYEINGKSYYKKSNYFKISGQIVIPVTENILKDITNNKPIAKFLDGGMAFIKEIKNINDFNPTEFIKI